MILYDFVSAEKGVIIELNRNFNGCEFFYNKKNSINIFQIKHK